MGRYEQVWYQRLKGIRYVSLLHYVDNHISRIKEVVQKELGWRDYRWKHCESVFTEFYQGYILPKKWNADKRKPHLSSLVVSGEISRDEALKSLEIPYYEDGRLAEAYDFVVRKFGLSADEFEGILAKPPVPHSHFPSDRVDWRWKVKYKLWRIWFLLSGAGCRLARGLFGKDFCEQWEASRWRKREAALMGAD
jgi:hypothetical protein